MITSTEIRSLRNADVGTYFDVGQIVNPRALAKPRMIADPKSPRILDVNVRLDNHMSSNLRAE
jgi:hypothetical protein